MTTNHNPTVPVSFDALAVGRSNTNPFLTAFETRNPNTGDVNYPIQTRWYNTILESEWILTGYSVVNNVKTAIWQPIGGSAIAVTETLTGNTGGAVGVDGANNINVVGDGTTINVAGNPGTHTLTISPIGTGIVQTLSDDVGTVITPLAGNIQLVGHVNEQGATKFSTIVAGTHLANINPMSPARWIVDALGFNGTHTTISSAIISATSGDTILILPGTYTENPTLKAGVNLTAFGSDSSLNQTGNVIISGTCTLTTAGTVTISGIQLQTNSAALLAVTGSAASVVNLQNCNLNCTNNTGITFSSSSASAVINISYCTGNLGTTGIGLFTHTSAGTLAFISSTFTNSGGSSTASTASAGVLTMVSSGFSFPITTSGSNGIGTSSVTISTAAQNVTALTVGGSGGSVYDNYASGTAPSLSVGGAHGISHTIMNSTNTNPITGAGAITYDDISFTGSGKIINTTTQSVFNSASFTPVLKFGGGTTGITYSNAYGKYYRVGNLLTFSIFITLTSKGSSTGSATVTGLPFLSFNDGAEYDYTMPAWGGMTVATATSLIADLPANSSTLGLFFLVATTGTITALADTNFSNSTTFKINGSYFV